jgi:DNA-binding LacI/PurR family transcriptional regulator
MTTPPRPTLRLLAKIAGVSATTASLALRGSQKISLSQRKHVVAVAARLGYAPDAKIAEFMAYMRTRRKTEAAEVLAYLRQTPDRQDWERSQAFEGYLPGAKRRAEELGYRLETFTIGPGELSRAAAQRIFHTRRIRGVILAPVADHHLQPGLDWSDLAVVRLGYTTASPHTHRVAGNPYRNMARCLQKLRTMGYRRIGLALSAYDSLRVEHQWRAAFADDWLHCRPTNRVPFCNLSSEELETWLRQGRPEVVVAVDASLKSRIEALGQCVPADIAFVKVGIEDDEDSLCGIVANFEAIGALAVEQLIGCMHRNEFGLPANPQTITVEGTWREGASCPALSGRRRPAR